MTISLDTSNPAVRGAWILHSRIAQLSIEISTGMRHSQGSVLAALWRDGYTVKRTKKGALIDLLTIAVAMDENYTLSEVHTKNLHTDEKKREAIIRKIYRDGKKWRTEGRPGSEVNP